VTLSLSEDSLLAFGQADSKEEEECDGGGSNSFSASVDDIRLLSRYCFAEMHFCLKKIASEIIKKFRGNKKIMTFAKESSKKANVM
jgi:hypothetical protein